MITAGIAADKADRRRQQRFGDRLLSRDLDRSRDRLLARAAE